MVTQPDGGGGDGEPVAAAGTSLGPDEPGAPELGEDVLQEAHRQALPSADLLTLERPGPRRGQLGQGSQRIVDLGGYAHGPYARRSA